MRRKTPDCQESAGWANEAADPAKADLGSIDELAGAAEAGAAWPGEDAAPPVGGASAAEAGAGSPGEGPAASKATASSREADGASAKGDARPAPSGSSPVRGGRTPDLTGTDGPISSNPADAAVGVTCLDPELQSRLEGLVKQLGHALRLRSFYPKGHRAVAPSLAAFKELLDPALTEMGEITISSTGQMLLYEGQPFGQDNRPLRNFADHLKVRDISGITFKRGVTEPELESVVEILNADPEMFSSPESPLLGSDSQTPHVEFNRVQYSKVLRHLSDEGGNLTEIEDPQDVWKSLVTQQLLSEGEGLSEEARELIARSAGDREALEQITDELTRAGSAATGDPFERIAKGLVKTCKGMEGMARTQRDQGVTNLAALASAMDPKVMVHLAEMEATDEATGEDLVQDMVQRLPVRAKLRVLTALVYSQRMDKSRLSSVFRRVAGARVRRQELLDSISSERDAASPVEARQFDRLCSAVEKLVLSESEDRFVGSDYVSMLEQLGQVTIEGQESEGGDSAFLQDLRKTLEHDQALEFKTQFLVDLARLQDDPAELARTLRDIVDGCEKLLEAGNPGLPTEIALDLADDVSSAPPQDPGRSETLQACLKSLLTGDAGQQALERLVHGGDRTAPSLSAALEACGSDACSRVWDIVSRTDAAVESQQVRSYLKAHSALAAETSREILGTGSVPRTRRVLRGLSHIGTPGATEAIHWIIEHGDERARAEGIKTLASMRTEKAGEILKGLLNGGDQKLAVLAATSLGESRAYHAVPMLLESLDNLDVFGRKIPEVRQAASALGKIGSPSAVPHLEKVLTKRLWASSEAKKNLRKRVALALRNIGDDEALAVLNRNSACYNKQVREICAWALSRPEREAKGLPRGSREDQHEESAVTIGRKCENDSSWNHDAKDPARPWDAASVPASGKAEDGKEEGSDP